MPDEPRRVVLERYPYGIQQAISPYEGFVSSI